MPSSCAPGSALERELSRGLLRGSEKLDRRKLEEGEVLVQQGDEGSDVYLLLDGVLKVEVDGEQVAGVPRSRRPPGGGNPRSGGNP